MNLICACVSVLGGKPRESCCVADDGSRFHRNYEMVIDDQIETLHEIMTKTSSGDMLEFPIYRRLFALSVISYINDLNHHLEELSSQLDSSINLEAISLHTERYLDKSYWTRSWLFSDLWRSDLKTPTTEINRMTDYFPNGKPDYNFTPQLIGSFKTAMHQFCDNDKLTERDLKYAVNDGIDKLIELLAEIVKKTREPEPHLYSKLCNEVRESYSPDDAVRDYKNWKEIMDGVSLNDLVAQQKIEIVKLLRTDFFKYLPDLPLSSYDSCKIKIKENDLPQTFEVPRNLFSELAKFDRYFELKGGYVIVINYEKLGKYIHKNIKRLTSVQLSAFVEFDKLMDLIHEDMSKHRSDLTKYLKNYEEKQYTNILNECAAILNTCQEHLRPEIRKTFLREYLYMLLFDPDIRDEARKKLKSASRGKYICWIVANLSDSYIFKPESTSAELAHSLKSKLTSTLESTIKKYIDKNGSEGSAALRQWNRRICDGLKEKPHNPFAGII